MRAENIKINHFYYYNNRKVLILNRESETDFFKVLVNFKLSEQTGKNWCEACNITSYADHTCDYIDEVIENLLEEVTDQDIMFIPAQYIMDQPFEYKESEKLAFEIREKKSEINKLVNQRKRLVLKNANTAKQTQRIDKKFLNALEAKEKVTQEIEHLYKEKSRLEQLVINTSDVMTILDTNKTITTTRLLGLLNKEVKLDRLEAGGVDGWSFYDISMYGENDELPETGEVALKNLLEI